jgi:hypothetical protein
LGAVIGIALGGVFAPFLPVAESIWVYYGTAAGIGALAGILVVRGMGPPQVDPEGRMPSPDDPSPGGPAWMPDPESEGPGTPRSRDFGGYMPNPEDDSPGTPRSRGLTAGDTIG